MKWIEMIHLRSYSQPDRDDALAAFQQLTVSDQQSDLQDFTLLRRITLENDLCIFIHWEGEGPGRGKSPLGLQLSAAFSEFGQINHSAWAQEASVPAERKEDNLS